MTPTRIARAGSALVALTLLTAACASDDDSTDTAPTVTTATTVPAATTSPATTTAGTTDGALSEEDCATNRDAGTITYLSSFDFSASASIIDVVVAKEKGYFEDMCLDVELRPGFSTSNYPLVAADQAQFSSAGNYSEVLNFSTDGAEFTAVVDYGKAPIEALVVKDPTITELSQLKGATIGVKGDLPSSIVAMLTNAGLVRGTDYEEVLVDGFDPLAHIAQDIDALPVYKSNEPRALDAAGIDYALFDPAKLGTPGSFGLIYASKDYADEHPTVVSGFVRAALKGMEDAIADPESAVAMSVAQIDAAGNQAFLTEEGETFRWKAELAIVQASNPPGAGVGLIDPAVLDNEYATYVEDGVWPDGPPAISKAYDADVAAALYDDGGKVIWPSS